MSDTVFITEPSVYMLARPEIDLWEIERFLKDNEVGHFSRIQNQDADALVEIAGRVCYMSFANPRPGGNKAYIDHILEVGHGSVLEHANFSLIFTGVSRSLTHELIRHRAGYGYSQLSQRYVDESDCAFVVPPEILGDNEPEAAWMSAVSDAKIAYVRLVERLMAKLSHIENKTERRKKAREAARSVLPNATETKIVVTGNARAWRHFLELRGSEHADAEIRRLALVVLGVLQREAPNIFGDYVVTDGCISTPNRKV